MQFHRKLQQAAWFLPNNERIMNPDPTQATNTQDTGTDGLKFDLPPGQTPGEGLGTGQTGMKNFNADEPAEEANEANWNAATGNGQQSEETSIADQDDATV